MGTRSPTSQPAVDALAELRRAPRHVMLRAIERLESAANSLDTSSSVPAGWFLSTASGYAMKVAGRVPGEVALTDACAMIEGLCVAADLREADLPEGSRDIRELSEKWSVAQRTINRYRARGLPSRSVRSGKTRKLVFTSDAVAAFEARRPETIERARAFNRMDSEDRARALARVAELQEQGQSPNAAARAAAEEMGRSHETIRQLLAQGSGGTTGWTARERRVALRAHDRFIEPADAAKRLGRDTSATRRTIDAARLERLRNLELHGTGPDEPSLPHAPLGAPGPTQLADLVSEMREASVPDRAAEGQITAYACFLTARAASTVSRERAARLRAEPIDRAETDLLWAARLRVEALRPLLGIVLRGVEARLSAPIESLSVRAATTRLQLALAAAAEAAHRYDPAHGGRLSAAVTVAVDRAAGDVHRPESRPSGARRSFSQATIEDWTRRVSPWQGFLEAPRLLRAGLHEIDTDRRSLLEARFGLGERPRTLAELAERFEVPRPWIARRVREAARDAIAAGRGAADRIVR